MNNIKLVAFLVLLVGCVSESPQSQFESLLDSEWSKIINDNPIYASSMGDLSRNTEWSDTSIEKIYLDHQHQLEIFNQLDALDINDFTEDNKVNYALFKQQYENSIESHAYKTFLIPFSHRGGIQLQHETTSIIPLRNRQHYLDWIERMSKINVLVDAAIEKARKGISEDIVPPRFLMQKVYKQIELQAFVEAKDSPFYRVFLEMDRSMTDIETAEIQEKALAMIESNVIPAYLKLHRFFKDEYLPACRTSIGIKEIQNGKEYYEFLARKFTTTNLTPKEIHEIGLAEVARIRQEMDAVMKEVKWEEHLNLF